MTDFAALKKLATLPTRTVSLCLAGELVEQISQLELQLAEAKPATNIGEVSPKRAITEEIAAIQEQMRESTVDFKLRALGARAWSIFWGSIPARGEKETQEAWEPRIFPFYAQLVSRSCVEPELTVEEVGELADILHSRAWTDLTLACMALNTGGIDIPNSAAAFELTGTSEQT